MKFIPNHRRWWARGSATSGHSLQNIWIPLLGLGGLLTAFVFLTWRADSAMDTVAGDDLVRGSVFERGDFHQLPTVRIRLRADAAGRLASIACNGQPVRDVEDLRAQIRAFAGPNTDATVEAELDCDGHLRYEHTQKIITAISAYAGTDGQTKVPLVDRVKFSPRSK
jgi:hypothetical protein